MDFELRVGIAENLFISSDDGRSWSQRRRDVPWRTVPLCYPTVPLPVTDGQQGMLFDMVHVNPAGFGAAVSHEDRHPEPDVAHLWYTENAGIAWREISFEGLRVPWRLRWWIQKYSWPPEKIESVLVTPGNAIVLTWTDPWLFEGACSHMLVVEQLGRNCTYYTTSEINAHLAVANNATLRVFGYGVYWETQNNGRNWLQRDLRIDWPNLGKQYNSEVKLVRWPQFIDNDIGYGLTVQRQKRDQGPPVTGLVVTRNGGADWTVSQEWLGPALGDVNERHVTSLTIQVKQG